jgi:hypothetical protein
MKHCIGCEKPFDPKDSIGSRHGYCQDCWEVWAADQWWEIAAMVMGPNL